MKKRIAVILALVVCFALFASVPAAAEQGAGRLAAATNNAIVVSNSSDLPDAHLVYPAVYKIDGANYFKLRDLAMILNGSAKQFALDYDDGPGAVSITTGKPYTAIGWELTGAAAERSSANYTNDAILIDDVPVFLTVYKIDGANYFKLRDLGKALDFFVGYNDEMKTVTISGAKGYDMATDPDYVKTVPDFKAVRVSYSDDERIFESCLNAKTMVISSVRHLPIFRFGSRSDLDTFLSDYAYCLGFDQSYNENQSFRKVVSAYGDDFFAEHSLLCVYMTSGSGSYRFGVRDVEIRDNALDVLVEQTNDPQVGTADMAGWLLIVEQDKADLAGVREFDAEYVGRKLETVPKQLPGSIVFGSFSFQDVKNSTDMNSSKVKTGGFVNVDEVELGWPTDRAKLELTGEYDLAQVWYDSAEDVWMVHFFSSKKTGGETVYLNGKGVTLLIVYDD